MYVTWLETSITKKNQIVWSLTIAADGIFFYWKNIWWWRWSIDKHFDWLNEHFSHFIFDFFEIVRFLSIFLWISFFVVFYWRRIKLILWFWIFKSIKSLHQNEKWYLKKNKSQEFDSLDMNTTRYEFGNHWELYYQFSDWKRSLCKRNDDLNRISTFICS